MIIERQKALVVGAGLVGSLWSIFLAKRGYLVDVYERRNDFRKLGFAGGRSINLAMSDRGWRAMEKAGIKEKILKVAIPMHGRMMHSIDGALTFQPYGKEGQAIYSVSRSGLNLELLNIANSYENVSLHFHQKCQKVALKSGEALFEHVHEDMLTAVRSPLIFGTDGAFSAVRRNLMKRPRFNYSQQYLDYGYKELSIPAGKGGRHQMEVNALHIWPRGQFMLIALPNIDGSYTCTLFLPFEGEESFENLQTDGQILAFFENYFPDATELMPDLLTDFQQNPEASLVTIRCNPWHYRDKVLLIGDASHAIVPFYGQGMNSGFEDCTILDDLMERHHDNWSKIIPQFTATRIKDTNAIADLALRNFVEMRDLVADPLFLLRKKIEALLQQKYPDQFLPVYSMVTFSHLPYSQALAEAQAQDQLFEKILSIEGIEENWDKNPELDRVFCAWVSGRKGVSGGVMV